jgi:hypothetical protein
VCHEYYLDIGIAVFRSKGFETIHFQHPERMRENLSAAFAAYDNGNGPVIIVASPAALESDIPLDLIIDNERPRLPEIVLKEDLMAPILNLLNDAPVRLLWQCGYLSNSEAELVYQLAEKCGAALCDSVTRPGSVSQYVNGNLCRRYLGTLGLYATSPRVHDFIHEDVNRLCLFLLKSRVAQTATPFPEKVLATRDLIEKEGYRYTGIYDVGRCAISAIRNVVRTGLGVSGFYGRALMGDGLMSVPAIAQSVQGNVLAFIGDGAWALVPDIVPFIIQQAYLEGFPIHGNLSLFRLCNGGHSLIRTYREVRRGLPADKQTTVLNRIPPDFSEAFGESLTVHYRRITEFDASALREQLQAPHTLNVYSVILEHNNDGDSLGGHSASSWQALPARH